MFLSIQQNEINDLLTYTNGIIGDVMPIVLLVGGIVIGVYILGRLTNNNQ